MWPAVLSKHNINSTGNNLFTFVLILRKCPQNKLANGCAVLSLSHSPSEYPLRLSLSLNFSLSFSACCRVCVFGPLVLVLSPNSLNQMSTDSKPRHFFLLCFCNAAPAAASVAAAVAAAGSCKFR